MRSVTLRLEDLRTTILNLGFVGENEHKQFRFDCKKMFDEYPSAAASLTVVPPAGEAYPAVIERDGDFVIWTITDSNLTAEGDGEIQLAFTSGEVVAKTYIGRTRTCRALVPTGEIQDGLDDFLTRAGAALTAIPETINEALAEAKASGEFDGPAGPAGQDGTDGQDGYSPTATVTKSGKVATITITDKNGTTTAEVHDGEDGGGGGTSDYSDLTNKPQINDVTLSGNKSLHDLGIAAESDIPDPTSIIDDTAGDGDTNKVWSADKTYDLLNEINQKQDAPETAGTAGQVLGLDANLEPEWKTVSGGGTVDDALSTSSENPVQNKVITNALGDLLKNTIVSITSSNKTSYFTDCDNAPSNSVYQIKASAEMAHSPMGYGVSSASGTYDGTVRSICGYPDGFLYTFLMGNVKQQFFLTNRTASTQILFFRVKYGSTYAWTDWNLASNVASPSGANFAIRKVLIAPYLDGEGHPTATDTGTPNPQYISDSFVFKDFDNAPANSIFQIDLDCDATVMANNPAPGKSSILITMNFGYATKHGEMQMCVGLDGAAGSGSFMYWRYGYNASGGTYTFTPWSRVNDVAIPAVSSTDNGKVLRVVDGVWSAVSLPSVSGVSF